MYIRKRSHKLKNDKRQLGYGLLENRRVMGMPKQKRILNLGQDFDIPEAGRVDGRRVTPIRSTFPPAAHQ